jgi:hypothetical protein
MVIDTLLIRWLSSETHPEYPVYKQASDLQLLIKPKSGEVLVWQQLSLGSGRLCSKSSKSMDKRSLGSSQFGMGAAPRQYNVSMLSGSLKKTLSEL